MELTKIEIVIISVIVIIIGALIGPNLVAKLDRAGAGNNEAGLHFESNLIPLAVSVNSRGEVSLSVSGPRIPTPIGTFSAYANVDFPDRDTLTVVAGERKYIYDLHHTAFQIYIPNDRQGRSRVEYDGRGSIMVVIPEPVWN